MERGWIAAALTIGLGFVLRTPALALADDGFGTRQPDRHVYDNAAVLTSDEVAALEQQAANMDKAGAPTVVYLRTKSADTATTQQDARDLMDAWRVESSPATRDGLVVLLNLKPGDTRRGSAALVAGAHHVDGGRLNADRLQAIYDNQMKPRLAAGDLAGAISSALDLAAADLQRPAETSQPDQAWDGVVIALIVIGMAAVGLIVALSQRGGRAGGSSGFGGSSSYTSSSSSDSGGSTSSGSDSAGGSF